MKIILDAYQYSSSITGTDRMAFNFLRQLQAIDTTNRFYVICSREPYIKQSITNQNFTIIAPPRICKPGGIGRYFSFLWRTLLPFWLRTKRADTFYSFHNMKLPHIRVAKKMIGSNLDLIPLVIDDYKNNAVFQKVIKYMNTAPDRADLFVSISEFSKKELCRMLPVKPESVHVIPLAIDPFFHKLTASETDKTLPASFLLTMGGSEPRKNVSCVVEAFSKLPSSVQEKYPLYIIGNEWHGRSMAAYAENKNVHLLGYVNDEQFRQLLNQATTFIFASKYEGFGFAILEAMACECPVISANGSSLDEIAGEASLRFDPEKPAVLSDKIKDLLEDSGLQKRLVSQGLKQQATFSWAISAKRLHALLLQQD